jgi:predicted amidohydrolase YtcJ
MYEFHGGKYNTRESSDYGDIIPRYPASTASQGEKHAMSKTRIAALTLILAAALAAHAQQTSDMIVYNGKIVTVDDHSFAPSVGTVAQAMHIRDGKVLHIGPNAQIRAMAGPGTKLIDLKGRTVLPGFILTHEHPWDWGPVTPAIIKKVLTDDVVVTRVLDGSPEENLRRFPEVLSEAVSKAQPGQWIYIVFTLGRHYEYANQGNGGYGRGGMDPKAINVIDGKHITKEQLDKAAPNNPVLLRDVFTSSVMNQRAIDEAIKVFPSPRMNPMAPPVPGAQASSSPARLPMRWMAEDVMLKDHYPLLREIGRLTLEWWAGYGMTSFASNAYAPANLRVFHDLDHKNEMPIRNMWTWNWDPEYHLADPFFVYDAAGRTGEGTDHLWFGGMTISIGSGCTMAEPLPSSALAKNSELQVSARSRQCAYAPGSRNAQVLYEYIKGGGRFVNMHTVGDEDIDNIMKVIVQASKDAGMTDEEVRAKRHGFDHGVMWPRPDQIATLKRYNFLASGDAFEITQASPAIFSIYGEKGASWVVPKKRLTEAQIYNSFEMDRALGSTDITIFTGLSWLLNRKGWDGKVYAQDQAVDRQTALKILTTWGAYYLLRENSLGSLEPGKWADCVVLDRDYLTVPEEEIANLRVLMTVVGGHPVHVAPSVAREFGLQPAGAQVTLAGGPAAQW